jgi:PAS domain S-box-containing protein
LPAIVVISSTLSIEDIWASGADSGATIEMVRDERELKEALARGPAFVLSGEDPVVIQTEIRKHLESSYSPAVEEMYASIFESSREVLVLLDLEGHIILTNKAFRDLVGKPTQELVGLPLVDLLDEDSRAEAVKLISSTGSKREYGSVLEIVGQNGDTIALDFISHLLGHNGSVNGIQLLGRDISEKRKHDADLVLANKKLVLLGSMTRHDILNKAMILSGYIEMAAAEDISADGRAALESTQRVLESVVRIMEATRNYQKLGSAETTWINIEQEVAAYTKGRSIPGVDLVCTTGDLEVLADPMFVTGLHNLIENAVLHGGRTSRITISAAKKDRGMVLLISDDGVGIPAEDKNRIFNWSYKNRSGHGLHFIREALAITDIEIHEVGVPGQGAVFELSMPKGRFRTHAHRGNIKARTD